jgi:transcriptional regulator NrdR family protein
MDAGFEIDTTICSCGGDVGVIQTEVKVIGRSRVQIRRRKCKTCGVTFRTAEVPFEIAAEVLSDE